MTSPISSKLSTASSPPISIAPAWFAEYLGITVPSEGQHVKIAGQSFVMRGGILRLEGTASEAQGQTERSFGFKWDQRHTFESEPALARVREWLIERYGNVGEASWLGEHGDHPLILDAGCGAGMSAVELFGHTLRNSRYLGVDISTAVDVAATRFIERGLPGGFLQANVNHLPLAPRSVDIILSEGVLHHTDSTERAFYALAELLKPGGRFLFYVYRKKGPVREFTDDYIREQLRAMAPEQAWNAVMPLTKLGKSLGDLNVEIDIPEPIDLLNIPAGTINLQRLFYWHVLKAFYRPELTLDEMNHINFDWYAPRNAHRQTVEEVRDWCANAGFTIERERVEEAGITIIAKKRTD
ncbi:MAG TPA: class I SAM-dependent methyltransferase [Nitrospiraceae bacterium]|nr:class I SAM-dependent methyltransferase [Nitrospiraceae bacterium]